MRTFVEVGVDLGVYSKIILDSHPEILLYAVEPWLPYPEIPGDRSSAKERALNTLKPYGDRVKVVELKSAMAMHVVPDGIDFVYIDAAHDAISVTYDLHGWYRKLRPGGILAGHDFDAGEVRDSVLYLAGFFGLQVHVIPDMGDSGKKDPRGGWAHPSYYVIKPSMSK
jgi:predicted O-methyltransferase YrrM